MTDKQTIIDGVDISRCKHYDEVFNYCDQSYLGEGGLLKNTKNPKRCECSPNCYYKQLKRKEQECEELQNKFLELNGKAYSNSLKLDKLKRTLIEIKKIAEILAPMTDEYENCYDRDRCFECDFTEDCSYFNTKRIIQICDEAISE